MWPALKALRGMGGSATNEELLSEIIEQEAIPPEIAAVQHVDQRQTRLGYNLAWAKTYLKKVGAVENSARGVWSLTKIGEALKEADIAAIPSRVRKQDADLRRVRDQDRRPSRSRRMMELLSRPQNPSGKTNFWPL